MKGRKKKTASKKSPPVVASVIKEKPASLNKKKRAVTGKKGLSNATPKKSTSGIASPKKRAASTGKKLPFGAKRKGTAEKTITIEETFDKIRKIWVDTYHLGYELPIICMPTFWRFSPFYIYPNECKKLSQGK